MNNSRRVSLDVIYQGKIISKYINDDLIDFSINDSANQSSDDITISLNDKEHKWLKNWVTEAGDKIEVKATSYNWNSIGEKYSINFGSYYVDEPEYTINPSTFSLKALSIKANGSFRDIPKSKIWKNATLKSVASTIALNNGFTLYYDSNTNPKLSEEEQSLQTDMEYLQNLCSSNGLNLKIYNNKLVIFSESVYESKPSKMIITPDMFLGQANFKRNLTDCGYDKAVLKCKTSKQTISASYTRPQSLNKKTGLKILPLNDSVDTQADALRVCQAKLREKNKSEYTASFSLPGLVKLYSAEVITLKDCGQFSGNYYIDSKTQSFSPTSASFECHKILGY